MDQLKVFWSYIVKYHFWILTSLVLIVSLVVFSMASSSLKQQVSSRHSKLDSDFNTVSSLEGTQATHPNSNNEAEIDKIIELTKKNVFDAWTAQYDRQVPILKWGEDVFEADSNALRIVEKFRPIERLEPTIPKDPLIATDRSVYRDYVKREFTKLAKIVGSHWTAEIGGGALRDDQDGMAVTTTTSAPLVEWSTASQAALQKEMAPWWEATKVPSTLEILYTQEDIWILNAILKVIQLTNGQARENFQAPIKEIELIKLGAAANDATFTTQSIGRGLDQSEEVESVASGTPDPADDRYVDERLKPMKGSVLREKMKSSSPEDAPYAVAKRIPIRLRVKMDQSKIPRLVSLCGNGDMMIEVKQVRINANTTPLALNLTAAVSSDEGEGEGVPSVGFGQAASVSSRPNVAADGDDSESAGVMLDDAPADSPVEIFGIVYLFNPPDKQKLGITDPTSTTPVGNQ
jgi:hypothetical protein